MQSRPRDLGEPTLDQVVVALARGQIVPHYQPVVHLATGAVLGWEVLARWQHPVHGVRPASDFVPVLEATGLMSVLDEHIAAAAFAHFRRSAPARPGAAPWLAINIHASGLGRGATFERIERAVGHAEISPARLIVELTESAAVTDLAGAADELAALRSLGVRVAIDDFGAGHASFDYLRHFPVDVLKLDRSFTQEIADRRFGPSVVSHLIAIGRDRGIEVIAEGIETEQQRRALVRLGCHGGQGFLLGRPLAALETPTAPTERPQHYPVPSDERERLSILHQSGLLDTPHEPVFDALVREAAELCGAPVALLSLVDEDRQWFKARFGDLDADETSRDIAFCAHAICTPGVMVVSDAAADPRFAANPLVTGTPHVRFYAGAPLVTSDGHAVGVLCVVDRVPRVLTEAQLGALELLARHAIAHIELRARLCQLSERHDRHPRPTHDRVVGGMLQPGPCKRQNDRRGHGGSQRSAGRRDSAALGRRP